MKKLLAASVIMLSSMSVMAATQSTQGGFNDSTEAAPLVQAQGGFNASECYSCIKYSKGCIAC